MSFGGERDQKPPENHARALTSGIHKHSREPKCPTAGHFVKTKAPRRAFEKNRHARGRFFTQAIALVYNQNIGVAQKAALEERADKMTTKNSPIVADICLYGTPRVGFAYIARSASNRSNLIVGGYAADQSISGRIQSGTEAVFSAVSK